MQPVKKHITPALSSVQDESLIRTLFPVDRLIVPINQLFVPKDFTCKLSDILRVCELIISEELKEPIIVNDEYLIIDGKKRYYAFKKLGYKKITVIKKNKNSTELNENEFGIISNGN